MNIVLKVWRKVLPWLPGDVAKCRTNFCRQGCNLACGYYVGWFLEEECRRSRGELPFSRGAPDAGDVVKRMVQLVKSCLATEKVLQELLGSEEWKSGATLETPAAADTAAVVEAKEAAVKDVKKAVLKGADGTCFPGVDMVFPVKDFGDDLEAWASSVELILTVAHKENVMKVREKNAAGKMGCSGCRYTTCSKCWWPKTVRYWRKLETGSKFAVEEGYTREMKAKTGMKMDD